MKKIISIFLIMLMAAMLPLSVCASENAGSDTNSTGNTYEINGVTVYFASDSAFTVEEQEQIAEWLVNGDDSGAVPYNLICSIFGHSYNTERVSKVTHKVRTTAPRCWEEVYSVSTCSRCGDTQQTLVSSGYIYCCA